MQAVCMRGEGSEDALKAEGCSLEAPISSSQTQAPKDKHIMWVEIINVFTTAIYHGACKFRFRPVMEMLPLDEGLACIA